MPGIISLSRFLGFSVLLRFLLPIFPRLGWIIELIENSQSIFRILLIGICLFKDFYRGVGPAGFEGVQTALVAVVLVVGGAIFMFNWVKKLPEKYTSEAPIVVESYDPPQAVADSVQSKFDSFRNALANGAEAETFTLSTDELNALIATHPDFSQAKGKAQVELVDDSMIANVSVPIDGVNELVDGRYFNGKAKIKLHYVDGVATYDVESVEVNGGQIPKMFIDQVVADLNSKDPLSGSAYDKMKSIIDEITIENGILKVVPKPVAERK